MVLYTSLKDDRRSLSMSAPDVFHGVFGNTFAKPFRPKRPLTDRSLAFRQKSCPLIFVFQYAKVNSGELNGYSSSAMGRNWYSLFIDSTSDGLGRVQASREASPMTHDMLLDEAVAAATSQGKQELERTMSRIRTEAAEAMEGDQVLQARLQAALDMLSEVRRATNHASDQPIKCAQAWLVGDLARQPALRVSWTTALGALLGAWVQAGFWKQPSECFLGKRLVAACPPPPPYATLSCGCL